MVNKLSYQELVRLSMVFLITPGWSPSDAIIFETLLNNRDSGEEQISYHPWFREAERKVRQIEESILVKELNEE